MKPARRKKPKPPASARNGIGKLWEEKYHFNKDVLGVADQKAREAADRTIAIVRELQGDVCLL